MGLGQGRSGIKELYLGSLPCGKGHDQIPLANPMSLWHETWQQQQGQKLSKIAFFHQFNFDSGLNFLARHKNARLAFFTFSKHTHSGRPPPCARVRLGLGSESSVCLPSARTFSFALAQSSSSTVAPSPTLPTSFPFIEPNGNLLILCEIHMQKPNQFRPLLGLGPASRQSLSFSLFWASLFYCVCLAVSPPLPLAQPLRQTRLLRNWSKKSIIDFCVMPVALKFPVISNLIFCQSRY